MLHATSMTTRLEVRDGDRSFQEMVAIRNAEAVGCDTVTVSLD